MEILDLYKNKYRIKSARLAGFDYASPGCYLVTICTKNRINYFGEILLKKIQYSKIGIIAKKYWLDIPIHFPFVRLDKFISDNSWL